MRNLYVKEYGILFLQINSQVHDIENKWPIIYKICFKCLLENQLFWFQYKILFKILGTKAYLKKVKLSSEGLCGLCSDFEETIEHLFSNRKKNSRAVEKCRKLDPEET